MSWANAVELLQIRKLAQLSAIIVSLIAIISLSAGCGRNRPAYNSLATNGDLELPFDTDSVPVGWMMNVASGNYRSGPTGVAHAGKNALVIAGDNGAAEIVTNPFNVPRGTILECDGWFQFDLEGRQRPTFQIKFPEVIEPTQFQPKIPFNVAGRDWQQLRYCCLARGESRETIGQFAVNLTGTGLVRIDDLQIRTRQPAAVAPMITDKGFEEPIIDNTFAEWTLKSDRPESYCEQITVSPLRGSACLRVQGEEGWTVMITNRGVPQDESTLILQGYIRVQEGKGCLKIDYFKEGKYVGCNYSAEVGSHEWTFVSVAVSPELAEQSDEMRPCLAAGGSRGKYSMDFDEVEAFVFK